MSPAFYEFVTTAHSPATDPHLHVWGWEIPVYLFLGGFTAGIMVLDGGLWIRVSAQIYNEIGDYERLAAIGKTLARL